ncbi:DUF5347 family protein [Xenorhabdus griffiniae]|uniref:DUF5347 family protein n=1 Tax=Xenorhabdus griffiniae TaxID=351672 RepID=UPI0030CAA338
MANTEPYRAVSMTLDEKIDGLNKSAELRAKYFSDDNRELAEMIEYLRDRTNNRTRNNEQLLHLIFNLAGFDKSRYEVKFHQLTNNEQRSLILAMNQLKALASILPDKLVMPELITH